MGNWAWGIGNSLELEFARSPTSLSAAGSQDYEDLKVRG
jgi:hypothetical protein